MTPPQKTAKRGIDLHKKEAAPPFPRPLRVHRKRAGEREAASAETCSVCQLIRRDIIKERVIIHRLLDLRLKGPSSRASTLPRNRPKRTAPEGPPTPLLHRRLGAR